MFKIPNCSEKAACWHFQPLFVGRPPTVSRKPQTTSHSSHARTVRTTKSTVQVSNELVPTNYWHSISEIPKPKERYQSKSKKKHQKNAPKKKKHWGKNHEMHSLKRFLLNLRRNSDSCCVIFVFNSEISKLRGSSRAKTSGSSPKHGFNGPRSTQRRFSFSYIPWESKRVALGVVKP